MIDIEALKRYAYDTIGAIHEVHKELGPGLNEKIYQEGLQLELSERSILSVFWSISIQDLLKLSVISSILMTMKSTAPMASPSENMFEPCVASEGCVGKSRLATFRHQNGFVGFESFVRKKTWQS